MCVYIYIFRRKFCYFELHSDPHIIFSFNIPHWPSTFILPNNSKKVPVASL